MRHEQQTPLEEAGQQLRVTPSKERAATIKHNVMEQVRRDRQRTRVAWVLAAALVLCLGGYVVFKKATNTPPHKAHVTHAMQATNTVHFSDGSQVIPEQDAQVEVLLTQRDKVHVALQRGSAKFVITPNRSRQFEVQVDDVVVRVLGTVFTVTRTDEDVHVVVERGRVEVVSGKSHVILGQGEEASVQRQNSIREAVPNAPSKAKPEPTKKKPRQVPPKQDWRLLHNQGDYKAAAKAAPKASKIRRVNDLMLAADTMRLIGKPAKALPYLKRVAKEFPKDPRAPLAQFTRGRLLLDDFGQPTKAAKVFARISAKYPKNEIAEHAHAREVEAWSKAGEKARAKQAARSYIKRYPNGPRRSAVQLHAEIQD